jgi:uncharacterized membrane protein YdjX (TVP38/TMEM64 family)
MRNKRNIFKLSVVLVTIVICIIIGIKYNLIGKIDVNAIKDYITSYGHFAALVFILFFCLRTLLIIFPYSIVVILGGNIFGSTKAFLYSLISVFISATLAFFIGRLTGKEFVQKLLRGRMKDLDVKIEKHGFKIIFLMRVSIIFPFDILNFAAGLSKVRYRDFIFATLLGIIPETFSLTYLGSNLSNPFSYEFYLAIALVILTIAVPFTVSKRKQKKSS